MNIEEYKKELERDPKSLVFLELANLYKNNGMIDEAVSICKHGLSHHEGLNRARVLLAELYIEKNMFDPAYEELKDITNRDPSNLMAHQLLEALFRKQGRNIEAEKQRKIVQSIQNFGSPQVLKEDESQSSTPTFAELHYKQGLIQDAIRIYQEILEKDPFNENIKKRIKELEEEEKNKKGISRERLKELIKPIKKSLEELKELIENLEKEI